MDMKALLKKLVETESPSHNKAAVDRVGAIVAEEARRLGANVEVVANAQTGDHVIARWGSGEVGILLMCHMDTVFPLGTLETFPYREENGLIRGPGVLDMKSGIVITLSAISSLLSNGTSAPRPITALFTSDEEIGSDTSRGLIESLARQAQVVFVMEGALLDGSLKTWRKGVGDFYVKVKGRAAHAGGAHKDGRNAIEEMAHQIIAIQKMTDYAKGTTLNVGHIQGGTVANVVPEECSVAVDFRVLEVEEAERVNAALQNLKPVLEDTIIEVTGGLNRPPLPYNEINQAAFKKAFQIAKDKLGVELKAGGTGGGSDGNFVAPLGVPVLDGLGAIGEGYHSDREYIFADSLESRAQLIAAFLREW